MSCVACITVDRQIILVDTDTGATTPLTTPIPRSPARFGSPWSMLQRAQEAWSWPTWSPDGQWIAAFGVEGSDTDTGPVRVVTHSIDGVRQVEWAEISGSTPIYLQWHPTGEALTVLLQQADELLLILLRKDRLGTVRPLEHGVPLFANWTVGGESLLIHAGTAGEPDGRVTIRDPMGAREDILLDRSPGSFCAPVMVGERAVYALRGRDGWSELVHSRGDGSDRVSLLTRAGLLAVVAAPLGRPWVALSHASRGEGTPYHGIELIDLTTGAARKISEADCLAFFFSPRGDSLVYAVVASQENCLQWFQVRIDGSPPVPLGSFWPTRDILFYLHFFDQYASSHPIFSPDGAYVVFCGYPAGGGQADLSSTPRIYLKSIDHPEVPPTEIGRGSFAVFPPAR